MVSLERSHDFLKGVVMPAFVCRWPNGNFSVVQAASKEEATILLDEYANADGCSLFAVPNLMFHFKLRDEGQFELEEVGEECGDKFWNKAYPFLYAALSADVSDDTQRIEVVKAVEQERSRVKGPEKTDSADIPGALRKRIVHVLRELKDTAEQVRSDD
jgi:hypothetical protein